MPIPDAKTRRGPWGGMDRIPEEIRQNGYVSDLIAEITNAAKAMGQPIHVFRKNADWFVAVMIPNQAELAKLDATTDARAVETPGAESGIQDNQGENNETR